LKTSGYFQTLDLEGRLIKYTDGNFLDIISDNKTFIFKIFSPTYINEPSKPDLVPSDFLHNPNFTNIDFRPISISVPNSGYSDRIQSYIPEEFNFNNLMYCSILSPMNFIVTPEIIKSALNNGIWQKTFKWENRWENGSYHTNELSVTIEFEKTPGVLSVSPPEDFKSAGPDETDRFLPTNKTYTLRNSGGSPIKFSASKNQSWLQLSVTSGTLKPKESIQVTVSIDESADKLKAGEYTDVLTFTNSTNGKGNTTRKVTLDVGEIQVWTVKLTGQETDDMGGKKMYVKMEDVWKNVTVDYGVRFDYKMVVKFTIKKEKGVWKYKTGVITDATVGYSNVFDPTVFYVSKTNCLNCADVPNLKGTHINGYVSDNTVRLSWPPVVTKVTVENSLKLKFDSKEESHKKTSNNYFESSEFFHRASDFYFPLKDGEEKKIPIIKESSKHRFKLDKRKPISIYYRYFPRRIK